MDDARPKRSNAGGNIGSLIDKELKGDDFYSTAYGGFQEDSDDEEYESDGSQEDEVDSDFDVDESAWGPYDDAEDILQKEMKDMKKKTTWIKPYKNPSSSFGMQSAATMASLIRPKKKLPQTVTATTVHVTSLTPSGDRESRNFRRSTQETSLGFKKRFEEEEMMRKRRKKATFREKDRKLTQEELLEEAKWTEIENLASLEAYTRMEEERKKVKLKKRPWTGPMVRYLSLTMPVITELGSGGRGGGGRGGGDGGSGRSDSACAPSLPRGSNSVEDSKGELVQEKDEHQLSNSMSLDVPIPMDTGAGDETSFKNGGPGDKCADTGNEATPTLSRSVQQSRSNTIQRQEVQKQSRNFLIFMDSNNFPSEYFPVVKPVKPKRRLCPVTRLPAKYIDPLTRTPYATPFAFKVIRTRYVNEAEEKCERRLIQLSNWLEEKKKKKMEST